MTMTPQGQLPAHILPPRVFQPPKPGQVIRCGDVTYYVGEKIGQGGFGYVYACTDEWNNDLVAKVLLPQDRTYDVVRDGWLRELQNLVALRHPNVTYIHQAFEYQDTFYLIIERCWATLAHLLGRPDGELWLPYVARDVLFALEYIHEAGYTHKDLQPENVFISHVWDRTDASRAPVWVFKVGDLGISKLEKEMGLLNTVFAHWMRPPEAFDPGEFGGLGKQVDIYQVGLLLLGLLRGSIPRFTEEEVLAGKPREMAESLSSVYAQCIARSLRRHVASRTQTPIAFWREIVQALRTLKTDGGQAGSPGLDGS